MVWKGVSLDVSFLLLLLTVGYIVQSLTVCRNASFNPGGWFEEPARSDVPLLNLRVKPRMSIYLETDQEASLLIDAAISDQVGQPLPLNYTGHFSNATTALSVDVVYNGTVIDTVAVNVGWTDVEVPLNLSRFATSLDGFNISVRTTIGGSDSYQASTEVFKLPTPENYGSVSRLDSLYGGLWVQRDDEDWKHIFPYTYYGVYPFCLHDNDDMMIRG